MLSKHSMVFYSSTLEVALCKKKIFLKRPLQWKVHTTDMYEWSMSSIKVWLLICLLSLANSLFLSALTTSVSPLSNKRISHENLSIKDISYQWQVFPLQYKCFITSDSHHIFCYIWRHKNILIITRWWNPPF